MTGQTEMKYWERCNNEEEKDEKNVYPEFRSIGTTRLVPPELFLSTLQLKLYHGIPTPNDDLAPSTRPVRPPPGSSLMNHQGHQLLPVLQLLSFHLLVLNEQPTEIPPKVSQKDSRSRCRSWSRNGKFAKSKYANTKLPSGHRLRPATRLSS